VQGSGVDSSLNEKGRAQAQSFHDAFGKIPFDRIYTSALKRSQESVKEFIASGIPHEALTGLNEISWGNREGQRITQEEDAYYHWILLQWQEGKTSIPIEGGESPDQVAARQRHFLNLLKLHPEDKNVLVCMHGRAIRIMLCQMLNYPLKSMDMFEHENLGLYLLHFNGEHFTVELYNNTDHLRQMNEIQNTANISKV
jgi:probable phosphoglycerate mutase